MVRLGKLVLLLLFVCNTCDGAAEVEVPPCETKARAVSITCRAFGEESTACTTLREQLATLCKVRPAWHAICPLVCKSQEEERENL